MVAKVTLTRSVVSSNINKTSYVENCETSAVGRALAMLGIGIDTSIASANEVKKPSPNNKPSSRTLTFKSLARNSMRQSRTSWTRRLHTSSQDRQEERRSTPSPRSMVTSSLRSKWQGSRSSCDDCMRDNKLTESYWVAPLLAEHEILTSSTQARIHDMREASGRHSHARKTARRSQRNNLSPVFSLER